MVAASRRVVSDLAKAIRRTLRRSNLLEAATVRKLTTEVDWQEYDAFSPASRSQDVRSRGDQGWLAVTAGERQLFPSPDP